MISFYFTLDTWGLITSPSLSWNSELCKCELFLGPAFWATFKYTNFLLSCEKLIIRMIKQGAKPLGIKNVVCKMIKRHTSDFDKFYKNPESITLDLFYTTISAEILRNCEKNSDYSKFLTISRKILRIMTDSGSNFLGLKPFLLRSVNNSDNFNKYRKDRTTIVNELLRFQWLMLFLNYNLEMKKVLLVEQQRFVWWQLTFVLVQGGSLN